MKKYLPALVLDIVLVVAFCAIGRNSHDEANTLAGLANTAWPFLTGLVIGWIATIALYRDKFDAVLIVPTGILLWLSTLVIGMALRIASSQGTALSFIIVAGTVLAVFLLGWRAVAKALTRARRHANVSKSV
ncbi:DUF3054 domain-containing protein [Rhodococcus sp. NPDC049939]|uniref:DUF3054 domain-containing protein n=1 Tax=Rhodococcus sp. NPDC049939 TaxID=3155511 RepID=UPI0033E14332